VDLITTECGHPEVTPYRCQDVEIQSLIGLERYETADAEIKILSAANRAMLDSLKFERVKSQNTDLHVAILAGAPLL